MTEASPRTPRDIDLSLPRRQAECAAFDRDHGSVGEHGWQFTLADKQPALPDKREQARRLTADLFSGCVHSCLSAVFIRGECFFISALNDGDLAGLRTEPLPFGLATRG